MTNRSQNRPGSHPGDSNVSAMMTARRTYAQRDGASSAWSRTVSFPNISSRARPLARIGHLYSTSLSGMNGGVIAHGEVGAGVFSWGYLSLTVLLSLATRLIRCGRGWGVEKCIDRVSIELFDLIHSDLTSRASLTCHSFSYDLFVEVRGRSTGTNSTL